MKITDEELRDLAQAVMLKAVCRCAIDETSMCLFCEKFSRDWRVNQHEDDCPVWIAIKVVEDGNH